MGNHKDHRQERTVPLWKRQEIQEVSWRTNAQGEFEAKRSGCSFCLPALRGARNFTLGSGSDEESLRASSLSSRIAQSSWFRHMPAKLATKAARACDTPEPTQGPVARQNLTRADNGFTPLGVSAHGFVTPSDVTLSHRLDSRPTRRLRF